MLSRGALESGQKLDLVGLGSLESGRDILDGLVKNCKSGRVKTRVAPVGLRKMHCGATNICWKLCKLNWIILVQRKMFRFSNISNSTSERTLIFWTNGTNFCKKSRNFLVTWNCHHAFFEAFDWGGRREKIVNNANFPQKLSPTLNEWTAYGLGK